VPIGRFLFLQLLVFAFGAFSYFSLHFGVRFPLFALICRHSRRRICFFSLNFLSANFRHLIEPCRERPRLYCPIVIRCSLSSPSAAFRRHPRSGSCRREAVSQGRDCALLWLRAAVAGRLLLSSATHSSRQRWFHRMTASDCRDDAAVCTYSKDSERCSASGPLTCCSARSSVTAHGASHFEGYNSPSRCDSYGFVWCYSV
jgi:hypothetical protein